MPRALTAGLISDQRGRDGKHMHVMVENKGLSSPSRVAGSRSLLLLTTC